MKKLFVAILLLLSAAACMNADELSIGATAPKFSLVNAVDGKTVAFKPGDGKVSVVVFTCSHEASYVEMPMTRCTLTSPLRTWPFSSKTKPTPGTMTRSSQPLRMAGIMLHQVG